jgi:hypothetical protein
MFAFLFVLRDEVVQPDETVLRILGEPTAGYGSRTARFAKGYILANL